MKTKGPKRVKLEGDVPDPTLPPKLEYIIRRLIWFQAPKVFVVTILLLGFMDVIDPGKNSFEILEIYAGEQRLVKLSKGLGISTASMDRDFDPIGDNRSKNNSMDLNTSAGFLLACAMVLGSKWEHFVVLLGVCCSTFVSISRGSTFRSSFLPQGCPISIAVYKANKALCRTVLLLLLIVAADGVFIVENPHSTLLNAQRRFQQLVEMLRARGICMYRQALWMKHFGHLCLKRTLLWSTSPVIRYLNLGPIRKGQHRSMVQTAIKYKDRSGKTRYKGAGATLKNTQVYPPKFVGKILEMKDEFIKAMPELPEVTTDGPSVIELLVEMPTGDPWDDAELWSIYEYVRGSKRLKLPEAYRAVLFQTSS